MIMTKQVCLVVALLSLVWGGEKRCLKNCWLIFQAWQPIPVNCLFNLAVQTIRIKHAKKYSFLVLVKTLHDNDSNLRRKKKNLLDVHYANMTSTFRLSTKLYSLKLSNWKMLVGFMHCSVLIKSKNFTSQV